MKWISTLCSCKELGEKFAMLTRRLESPYIIPGFLESLWLCIDERKEPLALSTQHRCVCVMILIFPSIFLGVAALAMEGFKCDTIVSSNKQDHRFSAALRSVDSWITGLICRLLAHIKSKTPFLERQMFEGLLLAPLVALSASVAVELRLHSKAVSNSMLLYIQPNIDFPVVCVFHGTVAESFSFIHVQHPLIFSFYIILIN